MSRKRRRGITLIEALVAIFILSIVALMVWGGFEQTSRNKTRVEDALDRNHAIRMALERMVRELSMAFVSIHRPSNPSQLSVVTAFVGTDRSSRDRVDFTSFSHQRLYRNAHESDQNEVSYFVTRDPNDARREVLARREQNRIDDDPTRGGRIEVLVEDVEGLELEYLDPQTVEWVQSWDTTQAAGQPNRLPAQVKIRLLVREPYHGRREVYGTRASLTLTHALNHAFYNPR